MPMTKQPVTITKPDANTVMIAVGSETYTMPMGDLKKRRNGARSLEDLLFQFEIALSQAGIDPNAATAAQIKTAIEAQTYWWGA